MLIFRRCLSLTPPVPDSGGRHRSRLPQSAMPPANHSGTPPHLHEHAAVVQQAFTALQASSSCAPLLILASAIVA